MKNIDKWVPSKFVYHKGRLTASTNTKEAGLPSRLIIEIVARYYDTYIKHFARGRLIDLGCGKVPLFEVYRNHVDEVICVDWENTLHQNRFVDFQCDLNERIPFLDGEFDTIILSDVLEHIQKPDQLWAEMARILRMDGHVIMNVPFYYWIHEAPYDFYRYSEYALRHFAESNGFRVEVLDPIGGSPEILADILVKNLYYIPAFGKFAAMIFQNLSLLFIRTKIGRFISKRTSRIFPLGYFMIAKRIMPVKIDSFG